MTRLDAQQMVEFAETGVDRLIAVPARQGDQHRAMPAIERFWDGPDGVQPALRDVLRALVNRKRRWPLYLHGDVGHGKTRAVLAFCDQLELARYWTVKQIMDLMLEKKQPWRWGIPPRIAVLDELGTRLAKSFEYDAVKDFTDWMEDRPTIYVSNQPVPKMEDGQPKGPLIDLYDKRIASRLTCGTVFELVDRDRRQPKPEGE